MRNAPPPYRGLRETTGLSLREIARRTGINAGRLSSIERGLIPTEAEEKVLRETLAKAILIDGVQPAEA